MSPSSVVFHEAGTITDQINVEISFQIIGLFSEGLYSSPNKAIEELVSNAFDADATCVHVVISPDRRADDASIVVVDNGTGMDDDGLKVHWIVGDSRKSRSRVTGAGRRTIGKFGIGKLAAYVLGDRLTHITKSGDKYYSTSMDFRAIPKTADVDSVRQGSRRARPEPVNLALRELTEAEARAALRPWLNDDHGREHLRLFGPGAEASWTVAAITELKPLAADLTAGRLRWVLSTAMPLRDDFVLFMNGREVASSKVDGTRIGRWTLGKDVTALPKPAPVELEIDTNETIAAADYRHWHLTDTLLGPVTGYVEVFKDPIDTGKSDAVVGRSNGFFVYVHGRLINPEDSGFGIDRNTLRHGTFSRFRVVVNMDRLDEELRSSRESLRDGPLLVRARQLLQALFNFARTKLEADITSSSPERQASQRLSDSPAGLTERPIIQMVLDAYDGTFKARHLVELDGRRFEDRDQLLAQIEARVHDGDGLFAEVAYADLGTHATMAVFDAVSGRLSINLEHPFVAHFADEFDKKKNLPLQLFAISEILLEAQLHNANVDPETLARVLDARDELLRHLARSSGAQNSLTIALDLINAASDSKKLEEAVVEAFNQLGFVAVPKAKKDEPDGLAEAFLAAGTDGVKHYRVSLEAKSKEAPGGKVKKKAVEVSTIARHRFEANCEHAIVIGPDFEIGADGKGAVMREIDDDRAKNPGRTITLMRIADLARLVRIAPIKRINLEQIRDLFVSASSPDEAAKWVDNIHSLDVTPAPYQAILDEVFTIQQEDRDHSVDYGSLRTALRRSERNKLVIGEVELKQECAALSRIAPNLFVARDDVVELNTRPDKVLEVFHSYVDRVPEENEL